MDQFLGFKYIIGIWLIIELFNCLVPLYTENALTEQHNHVYHENIGCFCQWNKEKFMYDETKNRWIVLDNYKMRGRLMTVKTLSDGTCFKCGKPFDTVTFRKPGENKIYCSQECYPYTYKNNNEYKENANAK